MRAPRLELAPQRTTTSSKRRESRGRPLCQLPGVRGITSSPGFKVLLQHLELFIFMELNVNWSLCQRVRHSKIVSVTSVRLDYIFVSHWLTTLLVVRFYLNTATENFYSLSVIQHCFKLKIWEPRNLLREQLFYVGIICI